MGWIASFPSGAKKPDFRRRAFLNEVTLRTENDRFNLRELLATVRTLLAGPSAAAKIPIDLSVEPTAPLELIGDAPKIRQILLCYAANALRHSGRGRVTLSAFAAPGGDDRCDLTLVVGDEGPGIAPDQQEKLFGDGELAVCRAQAEAMGGVTLARSASGEGAFFYLRLPLTVAPSAEVPLPEDLALAGPLFALVVEDREYNSAGLVAQLRQLHIEVEVAPSAETALARCRGQSFALFFLDRDLPGMSGFELARELRRQEGGERRAIIIATAGPDAPAARAEWRAAGMDGALVQPTTLEQLRTALGEWFASRPGRAPARLPLGRGRLPEPWRLDTLRYMASGDARELARRTRRYVRELDEYLAALQAALDAADFGQLRQCARRLVAHLSIIEYAALVSAAQQIEESAVNRDLKGANEPWSDVLVRCRQVKIRLVAEAESAPSD